MICGCGGSVDGNDDDGSGGGGVAAVAAVIRHSQPKQCLALVCATTRDALAYRPAEKVEIEEIRRQEKRRANGTVAPVIHASPISEVGIQPEN